MPAARCRPSRGDDSRGAAPVGGRARDAGRRPPAVPVRSCCWPPPRSCPSCRSAPAHPSGPAHPCVRRVRRRATAGAAGLHGGDREVLVDLDGDVRPVGTDHVGLVDALGVGLDPLDRGARLLGLRGRGDLVRDRAGQQGLAGVGGLAGVLRLTAAAHPARRSPSLALHAAIRAGGGDLGRGLGAGQRRSADGQSGRGRDRRGGGDHLVALLHEGLLGGRVMRDHRPHRRVHRPCPGHQPPVHPRDRLRWRRGRARSRRRGAVAQSVRAADS